MKQTIDEIIEKARKIFEKVPRMVDHQPELSYCVPLFIYIFSVYFALTVTNNKNYKTEIQIAFESFKNYYFTMFLFCISPSEKCPPIASSIPSGDVAMLGYISLT